MSLLLGTDWVFIYNSGYVFCVDLRTGYFFPLHFPTKICVRFSPVRCISSTYWNLICFRLVFQTPSFGLATLRGRLLRDTSYLTLRTTKEGERTLITPAYTLCHLVEVLMASTVRCLPRSVSLYCLKVGHDYFELILD